MDDAQTKMDLSYFPTCFMIANHKHTLYVVHRKGEAEYLKNVDWESFAPRMTIKIVTEGWEYPLLTNEWPHCVRLSIDDDFDAPMDAVMSYEFPSNIKLNRLTYPKVGAALLEELGPITDFIIADLDDDHVELRVKNLTPVQEQYWCLMRLKR